MEEALTCSICLDIAEKAVETSCCHNIFCQVCLNRVLGRDCPQCRKTFEVRVSHLGRRIIGSMPVTCRHENCGQQLTRSTAKDHERTCKHRGFYCPSPGCEFHGNKEDYLMHLVKEHGEILTERADIVFGIRSTSEEDSDNDVIARKINVDGNEARVGESGKYYCRQSLGDHTCTCCNGYCGPTNGCNCKPCMMLDIAARTLPRNFYVNRSGGACRESPETGIMYCGRKVMHEGIDCDGYCGPTDGPHCRSCEIMQVQVETRYQGIWNEGSNV